MKNPNAVALGALGGRAGGRARAQALSSEEKEEIARKAANVRWAKTPLSRTPGDRYGHMVLVETTWVTLPSRRARAWVCLCDCGVTKTVIESNLKSTKSCGCDRYGKHVTHGDTRKKQSPEYHAWSQMKDRCTNPNNPKYAAYGGRGITVCDQWGVFDIFLADMGRRPSNRHSLDRINNEAGYSAANCRWATAKQQANNRRPRKANGPGFPGPFQA